VKIRKAVWLRKQKEVPLFCHLRAKLRWRSHHRDPSGVGEEPREAPQDAQRAPRSAHPPVHVVHRPVALRPRQGPLAFRLSSCRQ
jgi:hypothetical protein